MKFHACWAVAVDWFKCGCGFVGTLRQAIAHAVETQPDLTK